ncbi:MAG: hypothetical protein GXO79_08480 [Chlorobi bacterium]|nr:hypothetical protein [Chlorobiota bacterium]
MKSFIKLFLLFSILIGFTQCNKNNTNIISLKKDTITGYCQKGPFNNGTSVIISELNSDFIQTGKNVTSNIENNYGYYEINNIEFVSQYVVLTVSGFYFNEISGKNSTAQLTLYSISDLSDKNKSNINILSHIMKERVEYLLSKGNSFEDAKKQAIKEILKIFEINIPDINEPELLDISEQGEGNAVLLAISAIFQAYRSTADLSQLLANFSTDIKTDGTLDSPTIKSELISQAKYLNLSSIRENIQKHYSDLGLNFTIPNFEEQIQAFIENTDFEVSELITYPERGLYGDNILYLGKDTFYTEQYYSLAANLPENAMLKIIMKNGIWLYVGSSNQNWIMENISDSAMSYVSNQAGVNCDLSIIFPTDSLHLNDITIEYYEFNSTEPTKIKSITTIDR